MNQVTNVRETLSYHHLDKQVTFDEKRFQAFLKSEKMDTPFHIECLNSSQKHRKKIQLTKVKAEDTDYFVILKLNEYERLTLRQFQDYSNRNIDVFGIYSKELNTLITKDDYDYGDLHTRCKSIKLLDWKNLLQQFHQALEEEFEKRFPDLREFYKDREEQIQSLYESKYNEHYRSVITRIPTDPNLHWINHSINEKIPIDYPRMFHYLRNPEECVKEYCDGYYARQQGEAHVRYRVCYRIATERLAKDLAKDKTIEKIRRVYDFLTKELASSKKIWLIPRNGWREKQVDCHISIDSHSVTIGNWSESMKLEEIKAIKYGRIIFNIEGGNE